MERMLNDYPWVYFWDYHRNTPWLCLLELDHVMSDIGLTVGIIGWLALGLIVGIVVTLLYIYKVSYAGELIIAKNRYGSEVYWNFNTARHLASTDDISKKRVITARVKTIRVND